MFQKKGILTVPIPRTDKDLQDLLNISKEIVAFRAEYIPLQNCIEYQAISKHFREADERCYLPKYNATIDEFGKVSFKEV